MVPAVFYLSFRSSVTDWTARASVETIVSKVTTAALMILARRIALAVKSIFGVGRRSDIATREGLGSNYLD